MRSMVEGAATGTTSDAGVRTIRFSAEEVERRPAVVVVAVADAAAPSTG